MAYRTRRTGDGRWAWQMFFGRQHFSQLVLVAQLFVPPLLGQPAKLELGASPLRNYSFREYGAHAQNWAVVQDPRGIMYFGNSRGVLEYDGVEWRFLPVDNHSIVRSLAVDAAGTVYVGAIGELGYLQVDGAGALTYVSLVDQLEPEERTFADVWRTFATPRGIYFWTRGRIFCWSGDRFHSATLGDGIPSSVAGQLLFNRQGSGLEVVTEEGPVRVEGGEQLAATGDLMTLLHRDPREVLAGTRDRGLLLLSFAERLDADATPRLLKAVPFETEVDDLLSEHKLYGGVRLPSGQYALATMTGGAVIIDRDGALRHRIDPSNGLQDPSVWALHVDRQDGLWLGLNNGITRVEVDVPWTIFDQLAGLEGSITAIARHRQTLYVATSLGLYALRDGRFHDLGGVTPPCWSLLSYPPAGAPATDAEDGGLLVGCYSHVYEVRDRKPLPLRATNNNFELRASARDPEVVYAGYDGGVGVLRFRDRETRWIDQGDVEGVRDDIRSVIEDDAGALWLGTYLNGAIRAVLGPDARVRELTRFGTGHGLPDLKGITLLGISGQLTAALRHGGLFQFDDGEGAFRPSSLLGSRFTGNSTMDGIYDLVAAPEGGFWIRTSVGDREAATLVFRRADGSDAFEPPLRRLPSDMTAILPENDGVTWLGGSDEILVRFDAGVERDYAQGFSTLIRGISTTGGGDGRELAYEDNSLTFHFAATSFDDETANRYSYRLDGYDRDWSEWTADTKKEYTNLPEADYRFRVRALNAYGTAGDEASFAFTVRPPWYRTAWAGLGYLLLAGLFIHGVARLRSLRLERERDGLAEQRAALEAEIDARKKAEIERERVLAERQRLIADLEARNDELARFNYTVAHDLKNPLTTILNFLGLAELDAAAGRTERLESDFARLRAAAQKLRRMLDELFELSRVGVQSEPFEEVAFNELVTEALAEIAGLVAERGVDVAVAPDLPAVTGDRTRLLEAVRQLLTNAIQYLGDQTSPRIEVGVRDAEPASGKPPTLTIRDNGIGIDPRYHEKVFNLFERLDPEASKGTGIGLALVKRIVELHGGRIWVESEGLGKGSTFCISLPDGRLSAPPLDDRSDQRLIS